MEFINPVSKMNNYFKIHLNGNKSLNVNIMIS